jgi:SHS2 domain-containing protein
MGVYTVLDHTADTGIEVIAETIPELVRCAATGMFELMADLEPCPTDPEVEIHLPARSEADMLIDALSELLYESEVRDLHFCHIEAEDDGRGGLTIIARGRPWPEVEVTGPPIKAVTYHDLRVDKEDDGWSTRVYFDV